MVKTTKSHIEYWRNRKIDWKIAYFDTWNHPHRQMIVNELKKLSFGSILEIGCAAGANLYKIDKEIRGVHVGGIDLNYDAIKTAERYLPKGSFLQVGDCFNLFLSDKNVDAILTDACLIYVSPLKIKKVIKEIKRVGRKYAVFCEFNSSNLFERMGISFSSGYFAHNFPKLLEHEGFYDIQLVKIPEQVWGFPWNKWGFIIIAKIP